MSQPRASGQSIPRVSPLAWIRNIDAPGMFAEFAEWVFHPRRSMHSRRHPVMPTMAEFERMGPAATAAWHRASGIEDRIVVALAESEAPSH